MEDVGGHIWAGVNSMASIRDGVCELRRWLNRSIPGSLVVWTTEDSRLADYGAIASAGCVDFYMEMQYGGCQANETHTGGKRGKCRANAPIATVKDTLDCYLKQSTAKVPGCDGPTGPGFGVAPWHTGLLLSWNGCDYKCLNDSGSAYAGCGAVQPWHHGDALPFPWFGGDPQSWYGGGNGADAMPWIGEIMLHLKPNSSSDIVYNTTVQSKYFNWVASDGSTHQM
jgi:hypothetical protein